MTPKSFRVCIFCGSKTSAEGKFESAARELASRLAPLGIDLVYGGAKVGLMGVFADSWLANSGKVYGVIPKALLEVEVEHKGLTELHKVSTMHERKQKMYDLADAFLTFPGGFGTLDETFEVTTWKQIGVNHKPVLIANLNGFYDSIMNFIDQAISAGYIRKEHRQLVTEVRTLGEIVEFLTHWRDKQNLCD